MPERAASKISWSLFGHASAYVFLIHGDMYLLTFSWYTWTCITKCTLDNLNTYLLTFSWYTWNASPVFFLLLKQNKSGLLYEALELCEIFSWQQWRGSTEGWEEVYGKGRDKLWLALLVQTWNLVGNTTIKYRYAEVDQSIGPRKLFIPDR